jgi:hypothetical protein
MRYATPIPTERTPAANAGATAHGFGPARIVATQQVNTIKRVASGPAMAWTPCCQRGKPAVAAPSLTFP